MCAASSEKIYSLVDYLDFLQGLQGEGLELTTIGGCAVGSYGRQMGETVLSGDLDLYATYETMEQALRFAERHGGIVRKRPQPRNIQVAFLEWQGKEVNILTSMLGMPDADAAIRTSRLFEFGDVAALVADPFDLLSNKLQVRRDKDLPHIEILRRFLTEEVVTAFETESKPRERIGPARRLLHVTGSKVLDRQLAKRLMALAAQPADWRFLAQTVPEADQAAAMVDRGPLQLREELRQIVASRQF